MFDSILFRFEKSAVLIALTFVCAMPSKAGAETAPIRIAFPSGMSGQLVIAMEKAEIAKKNGLQATFSSFQYGPPMMEALAAGSIDAVVTSLMPVTSYASKMPGDVKIVAMLGHSSHSLMVAKDSSLQAAGDLAGKKVGVSFGSDSHLDTLTWLTDIKIADKVELINVQPAELATALTNKSVDAIVIRQPQVLRLQEQSGARILHTWPFRFVSIVKSKFIAENPDAYQKYLKSLRESLLYVAQRKEESAAWFGAYLRVDPAVVMAVSKEDANYSAAKIDDIDISVTAAARQLIGSWTENARLHKMIKNPVDLSKLF